MTVGLYICNQFQTFKVWVGKMLQFGCQASDPLLSALQS